MGKIKVVYDKNLDNILRQVGLYEDFVHGQLCCKYCGRVIDYKNLSLIIPKVDGDEASLEFCCNDSECLTKYRTGDE